MIKARSLKLYTILSDSHYSSSPWCFCGWQTGWEWNWFAQTVVWCPHSVELKIIVANHQGDHCYWHHPRLQQQLRTITRTVFIHSLIHSLTHSLTHTLTHSHTRSLERLLLQATKLLWVFNSLLEVHMGLNILYLWCLMLCPVVASFLLWVFQQVSVKFNQP